MDVKVGDWVEFQWKSGYRILATVRPARTKSTDGYSVSIAWLLARLRKKDITVLEVRHPKES